MGGSCIIAAQAGLQHRGGLRFLASASPELARKRSVSRQSARLGTAPQLGTEACQGRGLLTQAVRHPAGTLQSH